MGSVQARIHRAARAAGSGRAIGVTGGTGTGESSTGPRGFGAVQTRESTMTMFNTAVFYDIENLLKGYAFSAQMLANLSLREILESAAETGRLSSIAVQRAYANWSDPRLGVLRGEITELGIEPVQVFGFGRDQKKNAADIQLAIDAVDLAHVRPAIEVFVIVSGDGGFASLAKKLHEYGKTVIGCAYPGAANRVLQAVCDEFVPIPDPEAGRSREAATPAPVAPEGPQITTPLVLRMSGSISRVPSNERSAVLSKAREVLAWIENDLAARRDLGGAGVHLSVAGEAIRVGVPDFDPVRLGFAKFVEFLQYLCAGTKICVRRAADGVVFLASRSAAGMRGEILPDLGVDFVHSPENYRSVLAIGFPSLRLPAPADIGRVATWLAGSALRETDLATAIEAANGALGGSMSSEAIKRALLSFVSSGVMERRPDGVPLSEQTLTLRPDMATREQILEAVGVAACRKLDAVLGEVRGELLAELLPVNGLPQLGGGEGSPRG